MELQLLQFLTICEKMQDFPFFRDTFWTLPPSWMCGTCCLSAAKLTRTLSLIFWSQLFITGLQLQQENLSDGILYLQSSSTGGACQVSMETQPLNIMFEENHTFAHLRLCRRIHVMRICARGVIRRLDIKDPSATFPYQSHRSQAMSAELF